MLEDKVQDKIKNNVADDADGMKDNQEEDAKNKKDDNVIDEETNQQGTNNVPNASKQCNQVNTRSYSLCRSILVNKDNTKCASTTTIGNIDVSKSPSNATMHSTSDIGNDTEFETEKEKEGKNWTVEVCMDLDIKIIGKAFVSSQTMGVESQKCS